MIAVFPVTGIFRYKFNALASFGNIHIKIPGLAGFKYRAFSQRSAINLNLENDRSVLL